MKITDKVFITITTKEAETGCQRVVDEGGLAKPLIVDIPAKIQNGMVLKIENAEYADGEEIITQPLYATIIVRKTRAEIDAENEANKRKAEKKKRRIHPWLFLIPLLIIAAIVFFILH